MKGPRDTNEIRYLPKNDGASQMQSLLESHQATAQRLGISQVAGFYNVTHQLPRQSYIPVAIEI